MKRYLDDLILRDLSRKAVLLTGPRQVGKTTLGRQLMQSFGNAQYLNWDVLADRAVLQRQSWHPRAGLLVMDEVHKMPNWKGWLKGVMDGRTPGQALLVMGRLFVELLRERVGSPLSLASIARDIAISPTTLKRYLDILHALFIVFTVQPWHRNIARAILQTPKVYFFDTGLVRGGQGARLENAVAAMLLKHVHFRQDSEGKQVGLHYIRTKDGAEVDFALSEAGRLTHLLECKLGDNKPHRALSRFAGEFAGSEAVQIVYSLRQEEVRSGIRITDAANWLAELSA